MELRSSEKSVDQMMSYSTDCCAPIHIDKVDHRFSAKLIRPNPRETKAS